MKQFRVAGLAHQCRFKIADRGVKLVQLLQREAPVVEKIRVAGIERQGVVAGRAGSWEIVTVIAGKGKVVPPRCLAGVDGHSLLQHRLCRCQIAALHQSDAEQMQRIAVPRVGSQEPTIHRCRTGDVTGLVAGKGLF